MRTYAQTPAQTSPAKSGGPPRRPHVAQSHTASPIQRLQRAIGNQALQRRLQAHASTAEVSAAARKGVNCNPGPSRMPTHGNAPVEIQPNLTINAPGDLHEQKADRVAEQVMRMPEPQRTAGGYPKRSEAYDNHAHVQTKLAPGTRGGGAAAPPVVDEVLRSPGQPLDAATRAFMEPRFGQDLSNVRVHADAQAASAASAIDARAFTAGRNIVFGTAEFAPQIDAGRRLLSHELTHVMQQSGTSSDPVVRRQPRGTTAPSKVSEFRPLTAAEKAYAFELFYDSVDYSRIIITRNQIAATFSATTIGNFINLQASHFVGKTMQLSPDGMKTLIHEMGHVWQYQHGGLAYMPQALLANYQASQIYGDRNKAYDWLSAAKAGRPWEEWNPEQQAACISDFNQSLRRIEAGNPKLRGGKGGYTDYALVSIASNYMAKVWRGEGAPELSQTMSRLSLTIPGKSKSATVASLTTIAQNVWNAMFGGTNIGTDEDKVFSNLALLKKDKKLIQQFEAVYLAKYHSDVVVDIKSEFSDGFVTGFQLTKALDYLGIDTPIGQAFKYAKRVAKRLVPAARQNPALKGKEHPAYKIVRAFSGNALDAIDPRIHGGFTGFVNFSDAGVVSRIVGPSILGGELTFDAEDNAIVLSDIRKAKEIHVAKTQLEALLNATEDKENLVGETYDTFGPMKSMIQGRNLGSKDEPPMKYAKSFVTDVIGENPTRALLGSFDLNYHILKINRKQQSADVYFVVTNKLTLSSLTRLPPKDGYGRSILKDIPGRSISMVISFTDQVPFTSADKKITKLKQ